MRLYNTLSRSKEDFVPREEGRVSMYVCGPTVYNHIHIGNARTFLSFDVIRRYLEHRGLDVRFVQNITDVDDKIIKQANEEGVPAADVARRYADAFLQAMADLGVKKPTAQPRATETIPEMIAMVERLIERGHAYAVDGDVYFAVRSFDGYGKLSGRDIDELEVGARVAADERKSDPLDFALWKAAKPGEPHWPSPWGEGRPGWHLECSVMSEMELGLPFDIHGGATDLIFPHHENEIAQSEAATGTPFVRYWMHGGLLQVNAEKMSKSLGNFMLLRDVLESYPVPVVRLLMLQTHYRSPLDFSTDRLDEARTAYDRLANLVRTVRWTRSQPAPGGGAPADDSAALQKALVDTRTRFDADMDDDFNTAGALGAVFDLSRQANGFVSAHQRVLSVADLAMLGRVQNEVTELLSVLGVTVGEEPDELAELPVEVLALAAELAGYAGSDRDAAVDALLKARAVARSEKNWALADAVRDGLVRLGFTIEDTASGARIVYSQA
ncbi:MAG: cysteine--tRNA ligase [Coriobacteriia bacterium]|nr:cysteine--tRNA ligase [Coriobacteriia bacterium]